MEQVEQRTQKTIDTLKALPVWGLWRKEQRGDDVVKMPYVSGGLKRASSTASEDWCIYSDLVKPEGFYEALRVPDGYIFIDFDHVTSHFDSVELDPLLEALGGYQEVSQSGDGYHVILPGNGIPDRHRCRLERDVEVYSKARFVALTWDCRGLGRDREPLDWSDLVEMLGSVGVDLKEKQHEGKKPLQSRAKDCREVGGDEEPRMASSAPTDSQILARALRRSKFKALHEQGDLSAYGQDHSKAVFAWLAIIAYYTKDKAQVDRLFKQSALYAGEWARGKWERLQDADQWTKIEMSVGDASWEPLVGGGNVEDAFEVMSAEEIEGAVEEVRGEAESLTGCPYIDLVVERFGEPEKDIMDGVARVKNPDGALEVLPLCSSGVVASIQAHIDRCSRLQTPTGLARSHVQAALADYEVRGLKASLQIPIPQWDGRDRLAEMSRCLKMRDPRLTSDVVEYFVKDWIVKCFAKIYEPKEQNRVIIFQGEQGIGKDEWLKTLCGGFGRYFITPSVPSLAKASEQHFAEQVYNKCVALFDEFVRLKGMEAILKALITREAFTMRLPYEPRAQEYKHRCSYVASCNFSSVLTDSTGNRRYLVFELAPGKSISWEYGRTEEDKAQIVAQAHTIYEAGRWRPIAEYEELMSAIVSERTPNSGEDDLVDTFESHLESHPSLKLTDKRKTLYLQSELGGVFDAVAKDMDLKASEVKAALKKTPCFKQWKKDGKRYKLFGSREAQQDPTSLESYLLVSSGCPF